MSYRQLSMQIVLCKTPQALDNWVFTFRTWDFQLSLLSRRIPRYKQAYCSVCVSYKHTAL